MIKKYKKASAFLFSVIFLLFGAYFSVTQPLFFGYHFPQTSVFEQLPEANANLLEKHVKFLSEHDRTSLDGQQKIIQYIINDLKQHGISKDNIEIQSYMVNGRAYKNIIVHFQNSTSDTTKKYIIGAHYDAYSNTECAYTASCDTPHFLPGADDNASGVAGVLEIANMLKQLKFLDRNVDLVFYSTEEPPFFATTSMGSYQHAKNTKGVDLAIILEMIGYFSEKENSQHFPISAMKYLYPSTGNFIAVVSNFENILETRAVKKRFKTALAKENLIHVESINAPAKITGIDFSDHRNYWQFDMPAVMITDTSFYRNRNYHTADDTYEKLDYQKMKAVVDATLATVLSL